MSNIPERNLDPPKDDYEECPYCHGILGFHGPGIKYTRYGGDGAVSKAEERRELEAAQGDKEYDAKMDKKMMEEEQ